MGLVLEEARLATFAPNEPFVNAGIIQDVLFDDAPDAFGRYFAVEMTLAVAVADLDQHFPVAHADAPGLLEDKGLRVFFQLVLKRLIDFFTAGRYAASTQAYFHRLHKLTLISRLGFGFLFGAMLIRSQNLAQLGRSQSTISFIVNYNDRGQRAAADAGNGKHRKAAVVGCLVVVEVQLVGNSVTDTPGAVNVAGRTVAHLDDVFAQGFRAKLGVERDHPVNLGGRNAGDVAYVVDGFFRNVAVSVLGRLEQIRAPAWPSYFQRSTLKGLKRSSTVPAISQPFKSYPDRLCGPA